MLVYGTSKWVDPDDAPHLSREWFERADYTHGDRMVRRGRPNSASPKEAVYPRLDADVSAFFRKTGPGWQTRINEALREAAGLVRVRSFDWRNGDGHRPPAVHSYS